MTYNEIILYEQCLRDWKRARSVFDDYSMKNYYKVKTYYNKSIQDRGEYFTMMWGNIEILIYNDEGKANLSTDFRIYDQYGQCIEKINKQALLKMMRKKYQILEYC